MESMEAHMQELSTASERLYISLLNPEGAKGMIDVLTGLVGFLGNFSESIGGGFNLLLALLPAAIGLFKGPLASSLASFITNLGNAQ
jgi:hypothetical protein